MLSSKSPHAAALVFGWAVLGALVIAPAARAGALYFDLVVDPATTAFAGIPAADGFNGTSSRSGAGTWHLYAIDDLDGSFGIRAFNVKLNPGAGGAIPAISNRSPNTLWDDLDASGPYNAGFSDLRSFANTNPITGGQALAGFAPRIAGFGIAASDFHLKVPAADTFFATTSGQWGKYADFSGAAITSLPSGHTRNPLFLAEGTYTGAPPTVDLLTPAASGGTNVFYWNDVNLTSSAEATQFATYSSCPICGIGIGTGIYNNVNANNPGVINHTFSYFADLPSGTSNQPLNWSDFSFDFFTPPGGPATSTSPATAATFDAATHTFHWNTTNAPLGMYQWHVRASAQGYSGVGLMFVTITAVPEPAAFSLISFATLVALVAARRVRALT